MKKDMRVAFFFMFIGFLFLLVSIISGAIRLMPTYPYVFGGKIVMADPIVIFLIGMGVMVFGWFGAPASKPYYGIDTANLTVKRRIFPKLVPIAGIADARRISKEEFENKYFELARALTAAEEAGLFEQRWAYKQAEMNLVRYSGQTFTADEKRGYALGDGVLVSMRDGKEYFMTPEDIDGFVAALKGAIGRKA